MRKKSIVILALVLVFALMLSACAVRRPMQTPVQPRQDTTGLYNNNRGTGSGTGTTTGTTTGTGTRMGAGNRTGTGTNTYTGTGTNTYTGIGPSSNNPYDLGYGSGNNSGYGGYSGYGAAGTGGNYGGTGAAGNYGGAGATGGTSGYTGTGAAGLGNPTYYGGYGGYGGYNNGMYGGYGNDYRNIGGSNNSPNYGFNNIGSTTQAGNTTQADKIARSLEQMTGVDNATVVVNGTTAYVGINTDGDLTGRNISYGNATDLAAVKRACAQRVKSSDPSIQTVYVSTDANFFDRLRRVGDGVRSGNPVNGFRNELTELVRRITPERQ